VETINYEQAHDIVNNNRSLHWDGWSIIEFKKDNSAEYHQKGSRYNGIWGFAKVYSPDREGWKVPKKYVR